MEADIFSWPNRTFIQYPLFMVRRVALEYYSYGYFNGIKRKSEGETLLYDFDGILEGRDEFFERIEATFDLSKLI